MAVIYTASFDNMGAGAAPVGWGGGASSATVSTGAARNGANGLQMACGSANTSAGYAPFNLPNSYTAIIIGFALKLNQLPTSGHNGVICGFAGSHGNTDVGALLAVTSTGALALGVNSGTLTYGDATFSGTNLSTGTWYYVEMSYKATSSSSAGDIIVKVDYGSGPTTVLSIGSGHQTYYRSGYANAKYVIFGDVVGNSNWTTASANEFAIDDVYMLDQTTGSNTTFLGNCHVECIFPTANGVVNQFTPSTSGHANYTEVNGTSPTGSGGYVYTSTVGNRDMYSFGSLAEVPSSIYAVQASAWAEVDAGETTRTILESIYEGGTYYDGATSADLISTAVYNPFKQVWDTNPATSAAWTASAVNSVEAGIKLVS